jgi:hypothetical protein
MPDLVGKGMADFYRSYGIDGKTVIGGTGPGREKIAHPDVTVGPAGINHHRHEIGAIGIARGMDSCEYPGAFLQRREILGKGSRTIRGGGVVHRHGVHKPEAVAQSAILQGLAHPVDGILGDRRHTSIRCNPGRCLRIIDNHDIHNHCGCSFDQKEIEKEGKETQSQISADSPWKAGVLRDVAMLNQMDCRQWKDYLFLGWNNGGGIIYRRKLVKIEFRDPADSCSHIANDLIGHAALQILEGDQVTLIGDCHGKG